MVVKVNKDGRVTNSAPCASCINLIRYAGIRQIYYSDNNGQLVQCKTSRYEPAKVTKGFTYMRGVNPNSPLAAYTRAIARQTKKPG